MSVIDVVPVYEVGGPSTLSLKADEAPGGELRAVLGCAKQRLRVGVVIAHPGSRVRGFDAQSVEHRQHRGGLERRAVVPCKAALTVGHSDPLRRGFIVHPSPGMNNATSWPPKCPSAISLAVLELTHVLLATG